MKIHLVAGAAVLALIATADASAATKHKAPTKAGAFAEPSQPVAYSKLDSYLKASPRSRTSGDWGLGATATASTAPTGTTANTSATAGMTPSAAPTDNSAAPPAASAPAAPPAPDAPAGPATPAAPDQSTAPAAPPATPAPATPGT